MERSEIGDGYAFSVSTKVGHLVIERGAGRVVRGYRVICG
jgi:hypothetical protein